MNEVNKAHSIWMSIIEQTISAGHPLKFPKEMDNGEIIPRPDEASPKILVKHIGEIKGQIPDWRASFEHSDRGFHAVEFADHYETHIDSVDPLKHPLGHLVNDSLGTLIALGVISVLVIAGSALAYVFKREK